MGLKINLPFWGKAPEPPKQLTPEEISKPFVDISNYVHNTFTGPAAGTRLEQFDSALATLAMIVEHLHDEATRMDDYPHEGHIAPSGKKAVAMAEAMGTPEKYASITCPDCKEVGRG